MVLGFCGSMTMDPTLPPSGPNVRDCNKFCYTAGERTRADAEQDYDDKYTGCDIRMVQRCENLGFALKSAYAVVIAGELVRQDLDSYFALQTGIPRTVYLAHPALPEKAERFMIPELSADGDGQSFLLWGIELLGLYRSV